MLTTHSIAVTFNSVYLCMYYNTIGKDCMIYRKIKGECKERLKGRQL